MLFNLKHRQLWRWWKRRFSFCIQRKLMNVIILVGNTRIRSRNQCASKICVYVFEFVHIVSIDDKMPHFVHILIIPQNHIYPILTSQFDLIFSLERLQKVKMVPYVPLDYQFNEHSNGKYSLWNSSVFHTLHLKSI